MSKNTLKKWMDEFNQLLTDLTKKLQLSEDLIQKSQDQNLEALSDESLKYLQLNQMANNNQDLYVMRYENEQFSLSHYMFSARYQNSICKVKLIDSYSEQEIPQKQYRSAIFEFQISENAAILTIKSIFKENGNTRCNQPLDPLMIKEVFIGYFQDERLLLFKVKNINICSQVAFHPLCNKHILILQTTLNWNKLYAHQSDQYFFVYHVNNPKQPLIRLNLQSCMNGDAQFFSFSQEMDESQLILYFINSRGIIYYYNLILKGMIINLNTKMYIQKYREELVQFIEQKNQQEFIIHYDCTTSEEYQNKILLFNKIENANYSLTNCKYLLFQKMYIDQYNLFIIVGKQQSGNLIVQTLVGENFKENRKENLKENNQVYEIYKEEVIIQSNEANTYHLANQPKVVYNKNNVVHIAQNQFDLPNRYQLILSYNNSLIFIDYSNVVQFKQDQSPINVTCLDLSRIQQSVHKVPIKQCTINQALCLDLFNSKILLFKAISEQGKIFYYLLSQKVLLSITEPNQELNKVALEFYQEKNIYLLNKNALKQLRQKLKNIQETKLTQCKTEDDIIKTNEELQSNFLNQINRIAIRIKLESENMFNDIDQKLKGDLNIQANRNIALQKKIIEKNEKINELLEKLKSIAQVVIHQQLKNQQKNDDLELYQSQYQKIKESIIDTKKQLEEEIKRTNRSPQDIDAIQQNLIYQIQQQRNK